MMRYLVRLCVMAVAVSSPAILAGEQKQEKESGKYEFKFKTQKSDYAKLAVSALKDLTDKEKGTIFAVWLASGYPQEALIAMMQQVYDKSKDENMLWDTKGVKAAIFGVIDYKKRIVSTEPFDTPIVLSFDDFDQLIRTKNQEISEVALNCLDQLVPYVKSFFTGDYSLLDITEKAEKKKNKNKKKNEKRKAKKKANQEKTLEAASAVSSTSSSASNTASSSAASSSSSTLTQAVATAILSTSSNSSNACNKEEVRVCAGAGENCKKLGELFDHCNTCKAVYLCSEKCQINHKPNCIVAPLD